MADREVSESAEAELRRVNREIVEDDGGYCRYTELVDLILAAFTAQRERVGVLEEALRESLPFVQMSGSVDAAVLENRIADLLEAPSDG